jgi:hypothetical protein
MGGAATRLELVVRRAERRHSFLCELRIADFVQHALQRCARALILGQLLQRCVALQHDGFCFWHVASPHRRRLLLVQPRNGVLERVQVKLRDAKLSLHLVLCRGHRGAGGARALGEAAVQGHDQLTEAEARHLGAGLLQVVGAQSL